MSKVLLRSLCAALLPLAALAAPRPVIIENTGSFATPDPAYTDFARSVAVDGDFALVLATRQIEDPGNSSSPYRGQTAFLYQRSGTGWTVLRKLDEYLDLPDTQYPLGVAMKNGIAAAQIGRIDVWENGSAGWTRTASLPPHDNPGKSIVIDGNRVFNGQGSCAWNGQMYEKSSTGAWDITRTFAGFPRGDGCDDEFAGGPVALDATWAAVYQPNAEDRQFPSVLLYHDYGSGQWSSYGEARPEEDVTALGPALDMIGTDFILGGSNVTGTLVYREVPAHGFHVAERLRPLDSFMGAGRAGALVHDGDLLLMSAYNVDRDTGVVHVFRRDSGGKYALIATLVGRNGQSLGAAVAVSGRRVLVGGSGDGLVHYFDLPASFTAPVPRQDTFSTGNGTGWTPSAGSAFATTGAGASRVYRQTQTGVLARAVYASADWTREAIETDLRFRQFAASGAGAGVATRWQGESNYFEAIVRNSGRVELRRMASGTLRTLASAAFTPTVNRTYRLRLESIGTQHRVYVDGALLIDADAGGPTHGRAALVTDRAEVDFDNVVLTPSPLTTIYATKFEEDEVGPWTKSGLGFWNLWTGSSRVWNQSSVAGDARASIGVATDDQVVRVRARLDTFATASGSQDRWFGVMARATDASNYYYLTLRSSNTLSLRKLVGGTGTVLASTSFTVNPATWYDLRLEAVGNQIRAYVNGTLRLEATDSTHAQGTAGPVMYKAAADYDDFTVYQP
ncbi:MAG TPA: hypothetical protein VMF52_15900 [Steroidobacteraceae bacterium]|nr:hypothetical protein [Steroidobacteraceae bacterium]